MPQLHLSRYTCCASVKRSGRQRGLWTTTPIALDHLATDRGCCVEQLGLRPGHRGPHGILLSVYHTSSPPRQDTPPPSPPLCVTGAEALHNYVSNAYRRNLARKGLFLDVSASLTWPREELEEEREINPGIGIGFEMYFGPVPDLDMR